MPPTVVILDDHPLVRDSIASSLVASLPDVTVAYAGASVRDAVACSRAGGVDCAILDLDLGDGRSPAASTAELSAQGVAVVIVSAHDQPPLVQEAVAAGARAYVPKRALADELPRAVVALLDGIRYRTPDFATVLVPTPDALPGLDATRERALVLYAAGLPVTAIAQRLGVTAPEVEALLDGVWERYGL